MKQKDFPERIIELEIKQAKRILKQSRLRRIYDKIKDMFK